MYIPFGYIEDGIWKLDAEERLQLLEDFVLDSGHTSAADADNEFWTHVNDSHARYMEKEFEEISEQEWDAFEIWASGDDE